MQTEKNLLSSSLDTAKLRKMMGETKKSLPCFRSYGILIWELVSGQDITEMQPLAIARQMHVSPCLYQLNTAHQYPRNYSACTRQTSIDLFKLLLA